MNPRTYMMLVYWIMMRRPCLLNATNRTYCCSIAAKRTEYMQQ